jgi:3-deoxy-D-manno-octulosonic-acid transferase
VPRHPQRFERVVQIITAQGMRACRRSAQWQLPPGDSQPQSGVTTVLLGDSLGEMFAYLQMSDLVLIGGSLLPLGGQNPLEACALGRPVFFGPHMFNFHEIARALKVCGAGFEIATIGDWITQGRRCLDDPHELQRRANAAIDFSIVHRGAAVRYLEFLQAISPADR